MIATASSLLTLALMVLGTIVLYRKVRTGS